MLKRDETSTGFIEFAAKRPGADRFSADDWAALRADADVLGLFGLMVAAACSEVPEVDPEVRDELTGPLQRDLADASQSGEKPLADAMEGFLAAKGERGPALLVRTLARVIYEVYDLSAHSFVQEDVVWAGVCLGWGGPGQDAREAARRLLRVSRKGARAVLGHLDGQLQLVHELGREDAPIDYAHLDRQIGIYAPRIYAQRFPSMLKSLVVDDRRSRFVPVLWARLRGVVIGRSHMTDLAGRIEPKAPLALVEALMERTETRQVLRQAVETCPAATRIEAAFRDLPT
jgi:hypothetical protein